MVNPEMWRQFVFKDRDWTKRVIFGASVQRSNCKGVSNVNPAWLEIHHWIYLKLTVNTNIHHSRAWFEN
jgi:hypothetical protein